MWSQKKRERWLEAYRELQAADAAYDSLPKNAFGHLEVGVSPEEEAWQRRKRATAECERIRLEE